MVNDVGVAEVQLEPHDHRREDDEKSSQPRADYELDADPAVHYCGVVQGLTDSHIAVIGHSSQKEKFN